MGLREAGTYLRDHPTFVGTARYWTEAFAKRASVGTEEKTILVITDYFRDWGSLKGIYQEAVQKITACSVAGCQTQVQKLVEMGFLEGLVRSTLDSVGGDENLALEKLCSG
ncbi:hypothetical protein ACLOJK_018919 [Asimina triloba]